jgi:hypothetical protein
MPAPHRETFNIDAYRELSSLSVQDRLNQVKADLTDVEFAYLGATLVNWRGMDLAKMSFFDSMRWWAFAGHAPDGIDICTFSYRLPCGQTGFARALFEDISSYSNFG